MKSNGNGTHYSNGVRHYPEGKKSAVGKIDMAEDDDNQPRYKSMNDADKIIDELCARDWIIFPEVFVKILKADEAILLAFLMSESRRYKAHLRRDGLFYCCLGQIEQRLGFIHQKQTILLKRLEKRGLIARVRKGIPPKRYIRINLKQVGRMLLQYRREHGEDEGDDDES